MYTVYYMYIFSSLPFWALNSKKAAENLFTPLQQLVPHPAIVSQGLRIYQTDGTFVSLTLLLILMTFRQAIIDLRTGTIHSFNKYSLYAHYH